MKRTLFFLFVMGFSLLQVHAQGEYRYFPTGMRWKEVRADPFSSLPLDTISSVLYEIGEDTLVNDKICKTIFKDGKPLEQWVIEKNEMVWIMTSDYPNPIMIYDFNWNGDNPYYEFLRVHDTSYETGNISFQTELVRSYLNHDKIEVTSFSDHTIEYMLDSEGAVIRHMGRVSDLNRNSCLLGYKIVDPILPGVEFVKVLWIVRDGEELFRSETAEEWITSLPGNDPVSDDEYIPILEDGKRWVISHSVVGSENDMTLCVSGDSVLNGNRYAVMGHDLLREEGEKVYIYDHNRQCDMILYDFSLTLGDVAYDELEEDVRLHVVCVDTIEVRGVSRKRIGFITEGRLESYGNAIDFADPKEWNQCWVEGIGSMYGPTDTYGWFIIGASTSMQRCYMGGECVFTYDDFFAKPVSGICRTPFSPLDSSTPYDLQGRKVLHPQSGDIYIKGGKKFISR